MTGKDLANYHKILNDKIKEVKSSKEAALNVLVVGGILTKNGNPTRRYKEACISLIKD
jgi:hypothetical protein